MTIQGLVSRADLNGEVGLTLGFSVSSQRWQVRLRNGDGAEVRPCPPRIPHRISTQAAATVARILTPVLTLTPVVPI